MADLNTTYHPYTHQYDVDAIKQEVAYDFLPDNVRANVDELLTEVIAFNSSQSELVDAVKVPYSTGEDRTAWLADRIEAIFNRMDQVKADVEGQKQQLINLGVEPGMDLFTTVGQLLAILPATRPVGAVAVVIGKLVSNSSANEAYRQSKIRESNTILQGYTSDLQQLNSIYQQVYTEYKSAAGIVGNAPKPIPTWYYFAGFAVLILIFVLIKRSREKSVR